MSLMLNESVVSKNKIIISISRMTCFRQLLAGIFATALATTLTSCSTPRASQISATPAVADVRTYLADVCAELVKSWPANRTVNIVCHGHSVPAGYAKTPAVQTFDAYPFLLHRELNERFPHAVVNLIVTAIGGENSEQGAQRFKRDVLSLRPDVVTIDYALNDRKIGLARSEKAWRAMIEMALAQHIKIILLTPTGDESARLADPNDPLNRHAELVRRLAREYHVGLADSLAQFENYVRNGGQLSDLMAQVNHPNRKGHELVAAQLLNWFPLPNQKS
jgi:lysophospholipase L1-like esterase